ncbi:MAG TPA: hypothetical protein HA224_03950 [Nanoarchaeota archaeon]|nr:hypothetical protein [Nanoarchaeota archaeon]
MKPAIYRRVENKWHEGSVVAVQAISALTIVTFVVGKYSGLVNIPPDVYVPVVITAPVLMGLIAAYSIGNLVTELQFRKVGLEEKVSGAK